MAVELPVHVWVLDTQVFGDRREAGLLLEWDRRADGWYGLIISAQQGIGAHGDGPYARHGWYRSDRIELATSKSDLPSSP